MLQCLFLFYNIFTRDKLESNIAWIWKCAHQSTCNDGMIVLFWVYLYFWPSLGMLEKALFYSHCFLRLQKLIPEPISWLWDVTSESYWKTSDSPQESKTTFLNPGQEREWWWNFPQFSLRRIWIKWDEKLAFKWHKQMNSSSRKKW